MVCYAYLGDVPPDEVDPERRHEGNISAAFEQSVWFTRGWTLQELIAPPTVIFLNQGWQDIGSKSSWLSTISQITGIRPNYLQGDDLGKASIAERMSWASKRETTRVEDAAYCLMGLFGVNMPLLCGEGQMAFTRLQEEIIKTSDDHSIFAWTEHSSNKSLLATSPAAFRDAGCIVPVDAMEARGTLSGAITVNNKGIHLKLRLAGKDGLQHDAILPCRVRSLPRHLIVLRFQAIPPGMECFERVGSWMQLQQHRDGQQRVEEKYPQISLCVARKRPTCKFQLPVLRAVQLGRREIVRLLLDHGADPDARDESGQTPLLLAVKRRHREIVGLLLEHGANVNAEDDCGRRPLLLAAENGDVAVAKLLLEAGADPNASPRSHLVRARSEASAVGDNNSSQTPLAIALGAGHGAMAILLREWGAGLDYR